MSNNVHDFFLAGPLTKTTSVRSRFGKAKGRSGLTDLTDELLRLITTYQLRIRHCGHDGMMAYPGKYEVCVEQCHTPGLTS